MEYYEISDGPQPCGRAIIIAEDHPFVGAECMVVGAVQDGLLLDVDGIDVRVSINAIGYLNEDVPGKTGAPAVPPTVEPPKVPRAEGQSSTTQQGTNLEAVID